MVEVIYDGNLGNNLFQYCFGRIIALKLGYHLKAKPINGFAGTYDIVEGKSYAGRTQITLRGQKPDLSFLNERDPQYHILLTGYFQRSEYYLPNRQLIREWLVMEGSTADLVSPQDVVVVVRRGKDYIPRHGLPLRYYNGALGRIAHNRVFICTNDSSDQFVRYLAKEHGAIVKAPNPLENFYFIKSFNKIIGSNSSFFWLAAFLSDAEEIVFPRPENGLWSRNDSMSKEIELEIEEPQYIYLSAEKY